MVGDKYVPNVASFDEGFPPDLPAPALLRDFAAWLSNQPRSSLGWFHLESALLDAKYTGDDDATLTLRKRLAIFMVFPEGSKLALWQPLEGPPAVVRLSPKETLGDVAPDLETFLWALANDTTGVASLERATRETDAVRKALAQWLEQRGVKASGRKIDPGAFETWYQLTADATRPTFPMHVPPSAASLPYDVFDQIEPLLGLLIDDPRVDAFFQSVGIHLASMRDPDELRAIARPIDGVELEVAWPWDRGSEWLEAEYPKSARNALELRRARMFWSVTLFVVPETKIGPRGRGERVFRPFVGKLPLGIRADDDATKLEDTLGPPVRGSEGTRIWDFPTRRRALIGAFNEGPFARTDLPRGGLKWLTWRFGQSL